MVHTFRHWWQILKLVLDVLDIVSDGADNRVDGLKLLLLLADADHAHISSTLIQRNVIDSHSLLLWNVT